MADDIAKPGGSSEEEVWNAIYAFEQILEAMPSDRASLEALSHAYEQIGDHTRSVDYLVRLGRVLIEEMDIAAAQALLVTLAPYVNDYASAAELSEEIVRIGGGTAPSLGGESNVAIDIPVSAGISQEEELYAGVNMADELAFAWHLMEQGLLTQEEYSSVVQDLTEMSSSETNATVSVLHALEFRSFKGLAKLINAMAKEQGLPFVLLSSFNITNSTLESLPRKFMIRRGVLVFDFIGKDALIVVMNPHNESLRKQVAGLLKRRCHFFLTLPSEFDRALGDTSRKPQGEAVASKT